MSPSAVQFARDFARLKSELVAQPIADVQLLRLGAFWPEMQAVAARDAYRTYLDEYCRLFLRSINEQALFDLTIAELSEIRAIHGALKEYISTDQANERLEQSGRLITYRLITMHCYLGDLAPALALADADPAKLEIPGEMPDLDAFDSLGLIVDRLRERHMDAAKILLEVRDRWEAERSCVNDDRAWCLFVEQNQSTSDNRGRLRQLQGAVELGKRKSGSDEIADTVTFDNQIKTPDDRFIGVVYHSLAAVRKLRARTHTGNHRLQYDARFSIAESKQTFTGDSIGFAAALIAYTQLLKPEIMRQERFIAGEVGFTGGIDEQGALLPVNQDSLKIKIQRAFFSPLKYLVLAEDCLPDAGAYLEPLARQYPCRNLILIGHKRIADVIENHNIVRSEKVCMVAFLTRTVVKYSGTAKIQVPLLIVLLWALLALLFPKIFDPWFDNNPHSVELTTDGFKVINGDGQQIWQQIIDCECDPANSQWIVGNIDADDRNEVAYMPKASESSICPDNAYLFVYDDDGSLLFRRPSVILGEYPGDTTLDQQYSPSFVEFITIGHRKLIMTTVTKSLPARAHIRFWDAAGDSLGWFINGGFAGGMEKHIVFKDRGLICIFGYNNEMGGSAALWVLSPDSCYGVSPPYNFGECRRGNQLHYLVFPRTDLSLKRRRPYSDPVDLNLQSNNEIEALTLESISPQTGLYFYLDSSFRAVKVASDDFFPSERQKLVDQDQLPAVIWPTYYATLLGNVKYWTDSGWVTEAELRILEKSQ